MLSTTISPRLQAKEMAKREEAERLAKAETEMMNRPKKRSATSPPSLSATAAAAKSTGTKRRKIDPKEVRSPARKANPAPSRPSKVKQEGAGKRLLSGAKKVTGSDRGEDKRARGPRERSRGEDTKVAGGKGKEKGKDKGKGKAAQPPKRGPAEARKALRKPVATPAKSSKGKGGNARKSPKQNAKAAPRRSAGGAGAARAAAQLSSSVRKALNKGPSAKQRRLFKLSKSLLPLGIWPSAGGGETFDLAPEWKASLLKRYEKIPPYRKLKANLYPDSALKGLVPVDEIPLCHCHAEDGCDADCINRLLLMECAPGRCPTLRGGAKHCENNAIQTKAFPATEIFRTFEGRGWGLRLSDERGAAAGTLLHEYLGEVITMDECRKRLRKVGRKGVEGSSSDFYFASLDGNLVLDAGPMGSEARFANHSCSPNCVLQKWSVLGETRVVLVAARDISLGEELTYNYQADTLEGFVERQKCLCGEPQCSGFIGGELVAVKAEEWQKRASKVMGQAKPQLDVVRELFHEGQELGYEDSTDRNEDETSPASPATARYHGREMECLSIMCKEGDEWLEQLADVMEGKIAAADDAAAAAAAAATAEAATNKPAASATNGEAPSGDEPPRRTSSRANRGVRKRYDESDSDTDPGGNSKRSSKVKGEKMPPSPLKVDLVALERVLERAPAGLHIPEAVKAKKTATRASQVARTVWMLLDAASKNGLEGVKVPAELRPPAPTIPQRQQQPPKPDGPASTENNTCPSVLESSESDGGGNVVTGNGGGSQRGRGGRDGRSSTGRMSRGRGGRCASEPRGRQGNSSDGSGAVELSSSGDDGEDWGPAHEEAGEEDDAQRPNDGLVQAGAADRNGGDEMEVCDDGTDAAAAAASTHCGESEGTAWPDRGCGQPLPPAAEALEGGGKPRGEVEPALGGDAGSCTIASVVPSADGENGKGSADDETPAAGTAAAPRASSAAAATSTDILQAAARTRNRPSKRDGVAQVSTRRGGTRSSSSSASSTVVLPKETKVVPPPPSLPSRGEKEEDWALDLPPKPKMTQVYQAIRSCKGLAPVFVPGASELEKLVAPAEAWAREACSVLKIKVPDPPVVDGKRMESAEERDKDSAGDDKERSKWEKLELDGSAMTALEEKLQEVAEFSLAREQREEEIEKERLLKEKEAAKERRERQARLDRLAKRLKRRNRSKGSGPAPSVAEPGNAGGDSVVAVDKNVDGATDGPSGEDIMAWEARRSPRIISLGSAGDGTGPTKNTRTTDSSTAEKAAEGSNGDSEAGAGVWTEEDEVELHCLCRLPADTARFRTLMTCDLCHSWFHPACVRLKELPESQLRGQALAFVCPMCEHCRGGVSNFACPPSPGFYVGRRMHRPGLEELEALMKHAESLPVDGVDGQAYLSYIVEQVAGWRDRCHAVVKDVQGYVQNGHSEQPSPSGYASSLSSSSLPSAAAAVAESPSTVPSAAEKSTSNGVPVEDAGAIAQGSKGAARGDKAVATSDREGVDDRRCGRVAREENGQIAPPPSRPDTAGVMLSSVGRDLGYEAALVERLGRLTCEGVLIEVVDVHKEDIVLRRSLWMLTASLCFPSVAACLRAGQELGLMETLSPDDEEILQSSGLSQDGSARLRPTFETLEASLTEGRTLGLSRNRSSQSKSKSRRSSAGGATTGQHYAGGGDDGEQVSKQEPSHSCADSGPCPPGPALPPKTSSSTSSGPPLPNERPSTDPLGAGVRVYTRLFDTVGGIIQAVVKSEANPFREARNYLPELRAATRWAAIEQSWGYSRALASELAWRRDDVARSSTAAGATATVAPATATGSPESAATAAAEISAAAMGTDSTAVEASPVAGAFVATPVAVATTRSAARAREGADNERDETDVYCICREGDDGGVMVECDTCSEWYHASCVGLTELQEEELQQYQCLVCCETHPEKYGQYKHRWTTNVAVEASVRRLAPRRTNNNSATNPNPQSRKRLHAEATEVARKYRTTSARRAASGTINAANFADDEEVRGQSAPPSDGQRSENASQSGVDNSEAVHDSDGLIGDSRESTQVTDSSARPVVNAASAHLPETALSGNPKRVLDEHSRQSDLPGAKRARAASMVAGYVERHYADLGISWPPERPSSPDEEPVDNDWNGDDGHQRWEHSADACSRGRGHSLPAVEKEKPSKPVCRSGIISKLQGLETEATGKHAGENAEGPLPLALRAPSLFDGPNLLGGQLSSGRGSSGSGSGSGSGLGQGAFSALPAALQGGHHHVYLHEHHQHQRPQQQQYQGCQRDQQHHQLLHQERQPFQGQDQRGPGISWTQPLSPAQGFPAFASRTDPRGSDAASGAKSPSVLPTADRVALATSGAARALSSQKADTISLQEVDGGEGTGRMGVTLAKQAR